MGTTVLVPSEAPVSGVCICTVHAGPPNWYFMDSVLGLRAPEAKMFEHIAGKQGVDDGHNNLIAWFLDTEFEWMLSLDSDAYVHPFTLLRLLSWNVPFVSALAFQRLPPYPPVVYTDRNPDTSDGKESFLKPIARVVDWIKTYPALIDQRRAIILEPKPADALWEVNRGGAHCCLIHRSVLEAIEPPWFVRTGSRAKTGSGSDFTFHQKVKEAGFKTYVDMSVVAGHTTGDLCIGALDFMVWNAAGRWNKRGDGIEVVFEEHQKEA